MSLVKFYCRPNGNKVQCHYPLTPDQFTTDLEEKHMEAIRSGQSYNLGRRQNSMSEMCWLWIDYDSKSYGIIAVITLYNSVAEVE